jgi:hypothetical protein
MKRDMEVVIEILKFIEENDEAYPRLSLKSTDHDDEVIHYHVKLMWEAGLIEANNVKTLGHVGPQFLVKGLTWSGHDFLDAARHETVVDKAKEIAKKQGMDLYKLPIDILKGVLVKAATELLL